jgi:acyl-CoA thioesterase
MSSLSEALTLRALAEGEWQGFADPRYEAGTGMFGGWTAALLLRSVIDDPRAQGTASSITAHFLKRLVPGSVVCIRTRRLGGSRSLGSWQAEMRLLDDDEIAAVATVIVAQRRPSDAFTEHAMPSAAAPETLPAFHPPGAFGERTRVCLVGGDALYDQESTRSLTWVRETSERAVDHAQLVYLADAYAPRIFFKSKGPRPSATITMSVYFFASDEELHAVGDDYILSEVTGTRAEQSTVGSRARMWSRSGALLATTEQLGWFK